MVSLSALAQDKVDFVLYRINSTSTHPDDMEFQMAKVEMTRERYDRMLKENLMMYCRTTKDKNVDLVFYDKQIAAMYKGEDVGRCEGNGCYNNSFEDLSGPLNGASKAVHDHETSLSKDYYMGSVANYEAYRARRISWDWNLPASSEIPYVTIYDPAIHDPKKTPAKNSFYCIMAKLDGTRVSP